MKVWEWVLDGLSFVLGEKRAKTARELFPDAVDTRAPLLFFFSFLFQVGLTRNPITSKVNSFDVDTDTHSTSLCSHVVSGVHESQEFETGKGLFWGPLGAMIYSRPVAK